LCETDPSSFSTISSILSNTERTPGVTSIFLLFDYFVGSSTYAGISCIDVKHLCCILKNVGLKIGAQKVVRPTMSKVDS
jgi:hypothetical protein